MASEVRILIVEDEYITANDIRDNLEAMGYKIAGMARDAHEACSILDEEQTDLVMLDINIQGDKDGIWVAKRINSHYNLPFIFLTSFGDEKTVTSAIETEPFGYLVKPFERVDIYTTIEVALKNYHQIKSASKKNSENKERLNPLNIDDFLFVKEKHLYSKVNLRDVLYISTELKHVQIHTKSKTYLMRYNFNEFAESLPQDHFLQTHRSYYVNKSAIENVGHGFVIINGTEIPISSSKRADFLNKFKFY